MLRTSDKKNSCSYISLLDLWVQYALHYTSLDHSTDLSITKKSMLRKENMDYFINISSPVNVAMIGSNILKTDFGRTIINLLQEKCIEQFEKERGRETKREKKYIFNLLKLLSSNQNGFP